MVPVPGRSTHSNAWLWHAKQKGCGGRTKVPQTVHCGAREAALGRGVPEGLGQVVGVGVLHHGGEGAPGEIGHAFVARSLVVASVSCAAACR